MAAPHTERAEFEDVTAHSSELESPLQLRFWTFTGRLWPIALLFGAVMFLIAMGLDWLLLRDREAPLILVAISNVAVGVLAAALVLTLLHYGRAQRRLILHRIETLNEANHHIRNALQAIAFSLGSLKDHKEAPQISNAMSRIQWVLRSILPKVEPSYEPFEGSARQSAATNLPPDDPGL